MDRAGSGVTKPPRVFANTFKAVFGVGLGVVASLAAAALAITAIWAVTVWVQNPAAEASERARKSLRLAELTEKKYAYLESLCAELPPRPNRYSQYVAMPPPPTYTDDQKRVAQARAIEEAKALRFADLVRDACGVE